MKECRIKYEEIDLLPPIKREQLAMIESVLTNSPNLSCTSEELISGLNKVSRRLKPIHDKSYLQKLLKQLNEDIYGYVKGNPDSGANYISRGPIHRIRNIEYLAFPEQIIHAKDRSYLNKLLRIVSLFDGAVPLGQILRNQRHHNKALESILSDATHHAELDLDINISTLIEILYESIEDKYIVKFRYPPLDKDKDIIVSPYKLKRFNNKWFLLGYVHGSKFSWSVLSLNRIIGNISIDKDRILVFKQLYEKNAIDKYYEYVIGYEVPYYDYKTDEIPPILSSDNLKVLDIIISCKNERTFNLVCENPIHHTQISNKEDQTIRLKVVENNLLYQSILKLGDGVEVIAPDKVRQEISSRLRKALNYYQN